jgi:hypothetical protein
MSKEDLSKVVDLQEELGSPFIVIHKPKAKNKIVEYDSDTAVFDIMDDELIFDFWELEGFSIGLDKIKRVVIEVIDNMTIVYFKLKYGNTVMLHFMSR